MLYPSRWGLSFATAGECIEAVSGEMTFFTLPNCFELFGFDLLLDEHWRPWLLEARFLHLFLI